MGQFHLYVPKSVLSDFNLSSPNSLFGRHISQPPVILKFWKLACLSMLICGGEQNWFYSFVLFRIQNFLYSCHLYEAQIDGKFRFTWIKLFYTWKFESYFYFTSSTHQTMSPTSTSRSKTYLTFIQMVPCDQWPLFWYHRHVSRYKKKN